MADEELAKVTEIMELLFFAYRDFISDPDEILDRYEFGRAHHRIIHFVGRHPGIRVAELLDILRITKQSLGRVLKELVDKGFIEQKESVKDRRRRLLSLTETGCALHRELMSPQIKRVQAALKQTGAGVDGLHRDVLFAMIDRDDRDHVASLFSQATASCETNKP